MTPAAAARDQRGFALLAVSLVLAVFYLPYLGCALLAFRGRNWARIVTTVMSALAVLVLVIVALSGVGAVAAILLLEVVLVAASIALHFTPHARRYFTAVEQARLAAPRR